MPYLLAKDRCVLLQITPTVHSPLGGDGEFDQQSEYRGYNCPDLGLPSL